MKKYYYTKVIYNFPLQTKYEIYEMFDWCEESIGAKNKDWFYTDVGLFQFMREEDRAMFILYASGLDCVKRVETGPKDFYVI